MKNLVNDVQILQIPVFVLSFFAKSSTFVCLFVGFNFIDRRVFARNPSQHWREEDGCSKNCKHYPKNLFQNFTPKNCNPRQKFVTGLMTTQVTRSRLTNLYLHTVDTASQAFGMLFFSGNSFFVARNAS